MFYAKVNDFFESAKFPVRSSGGEYILTSTKNGKSRIIAPANYVMQFLTNQRKLQEASMSFPAGIHRSAAPLIY